MGLELIAQHNPGSATYDYKTYRLTHEENRYQEIVRVYRNGSLVFWTGTLQSAVDWIDAKS